jgi:hypothetical protein
MSTDRFTLIVIVLITAIVSGTVMTVLKAIPPDTMTHMLATIVGIVGGALSVQPSPVQVAQAMQKLSGRPPPNVPEIIKP